MKKLALSLFCFVLSLSCFSQECESSYNSAMEFYNKGDFPSALVFFNQVKDKCGVYKDVIQKIQECESITQKSTNPTPESEDPKQGTSKSTITLVGDGNVSFGPQGGMETVQVKSNSTWKHQKAPAWLTLKKEKGQLVIECEDNANRENRSTDIILYSGEGSDRVTKKIHVTQDVSTLRVGKTYVNLSEGGSTERIQVESNDDWEVVTQPGGWFYVTKYERSVTVSCTKNPKISARQGTFRIRTLHGKAVEIEVRQGKSTPILEIEETSIKASSNAGYYRIRINSNSPDWSPRVEGGSWCMVEKKNDQELLLTVNTNDSGYTRSAKIIVSAMNNALAKEITVTQKSLGYGSLYEDYFSNRGGTWKITPLSAGVYGGFSWGLRVSGYMVRWKVVEADLLNLNMSFSKQSLLLSWEPVVRGYLPLQRDGLAWTPYIGIGGCVPFVDKPWQEDVMTKHSNLLIELGTEFNFIIGNDRPVSSRLFIRMDGYFSIGASFDLHKWK